MAKLLVLILTAILMAVTNPGVQEFEVYMQSQVTSQARQQGAGWLVDAATAFKAVTGFDGVKTYTKLLVSDVQRTDLVVGSIYVINIGGRSYTWLGIFRNFIQIGG